MANRTRAARAGVGTSNPRAPHTRPPPFERCPTEKNSGVRRVRRRRQQWAVPHSARAREGAARTTARVDAVKCRLHWSSGEFALRQACVACPALKSPVEARDTPRCTRSIALASTAESRSKLPACGGQDGIASETACKSAQGSIASGLWAASMPDRARELLTVNGLNVEGHTGPAP